MQTLIRIIKSIQIKQVLTVFLLSGFLLVGTACSDSNVAQAGGKGNTETAKRAMSDTYDDYDANQGFKGGMNGYNDDRRYDVETAAKAKGLVDAAESRLNKGGANVDLDDITDRVGNKIDQAQREIPRTLGNKKDRAVDYVQDKSENLKDNLGKVPGEAKEIFNEATDTAGNAHEDATQATKSTAKRIKSNVKDLT